jgi:hypothetical protein
MHRAWRYLEAPDNRQRGVTRLRIGHSLVETVGRLATIFGSASHIYKYGVQLGNSFAEELRVTIEWCGTQTAHN